MSTIKSVAQQAAVSVTTVSHAINHPERVTPELRERVLRAVRDLRYEPSPSARSLRTGRSSLVALMLSDICNPFFPELARGVQDELAGAGYDVLIYNTDAGGAGHHLRQIGPKRFAGLLLVGEALRGAEDELAALRVPAVSIGHLEQPGIDVVTFDDFRAAYAAADFLITRGHRRVAHIAGDQALWSGRERRRGFLQALEDHRHAPDEQLIAPGDYTRAAGADGMRALLGLADPPTAVFAANALMAVAALGAALDMGRRVPDDVAVVGFDDIAALADVRPAVTTVACSPRAIGQAAARLLLERLSGAQREPRTLTLPHDLIIREST